MTDKATYTSTVTSGRLSDDGLAQLIAACVRKERKAQRQLYDAYAAFIFGIIRRYTEDSDAAQEIQSDAFYRIFTRLEQYRFEGAFEGWIRRIAVHAVAEYFRKHHLVTTSLPEDTEETAAYYDSGGMGKLVYQELLAMIHGLPATQRAVFNLFVFEQYTHREIATLLGITENNSRWQLNDARRRLKEQIIATDR